MFEEVNDQEKLIIFNNIWTKCWLEKNFELEYSEEISRRFVIIYEGEYVGTVESKKFYNEINDVFPFQTEDHELNLTSSTVYEIDKVSILPEYRGIQILKCIISLLYDFAIHNNVTHYIALTEPRLFTALVKYYKFPINRLGDNFFFKGDYVVPSSIKCKEVFDNTVKHSRWDILKTRSLTLTT